MLMIGVSEDMQVLCEDMSGWVLLYCYSKEAVSWISTHFFAKNVKTKLNDKLSYKHNGIKENVHVVV